MKKISNTISCYCLFAFFFFSCKKNTVDSPTFDVQLDSLSFKVGDSIHYKMSGSADYIGYYSGESVANYPILLGYRYDYNSRVLADGDAFVQFQSLLQNVSQANTLSVLASTDFNGTYDSLNIYKATWTDITSRFVLSDGSSGPTPTPSGLVNVSDFKNGPVFFAFRYLAKSGLQQPKWTITNLSTNFYARGSDTVASTKDTFTVATLNPAWKVINISNSSGKWAATTSQLQITGGNTTAPANENWVISKDYYLNRVPTDKAIPIKTYTDAMLNDYVAKPYTKPGMYKVNFVASNANFKDYKSINKAFVIKVNQ